MQHLTKRNNTNQETRTNNLAHRNCATAIRRGGRPAIGAPLRSLAAQGGYTVSGLQRQMLAMWSAVQLLLTCTAAVRNYKEREDSQQVCKIVERGNGDYNRNTEKRIEIGISQNWTAYHDHGGKSTGKAVAKRKQPIITTADQCKYCQA